MSYGFSPSTSPLSAPGWLPPEPSLGITYADLPIATSPGHWCEPFTIGVRTIEGWFEPAPIDDETFTAPGGHGVLRMAPRRGPRAITLKGWVYAPVGIGPLEDAMDQISASKRSVLQVRERARDLWRESDVILTRATFTRVAPVWATMTLSFQADDPVRYGTGSQDLKNGRNVLLNRGNATCYPIVDLVGPHQPISIEHPGGTYQFPALSAGQRRTIDCASGNVWNGNQRVFVGSGPWPRINEGGATWNISGVGSGSGKVRRAEGWM